MRKVLAFFLSLMFLLLPACGSDDAQEQSTGDGLSPSGAEKEGETDMSEVDFSDFANVELINAALDDMSGEQLAVLYQQARYCQTMTDADTDTLRQMVSEDATFTHMSGRQQTREEYFADIELYQAKRTGKRPLVNERKGRRMCESMSVYFNSMRSVL